MMLCPSLSHKNGDMNRVNSQTPMLNNSRLIIEDSRKCRLPRHVDFPLTKWNGQRTTENPAELKLGACKLTSERILFDPMARRHYKNGRSSGVDPKKTESRVRDSPGQPATWSYQLPVRIRWFMIILSPHSFCRNSMRHIPAQPAFRERHHGLLPQDSNDGPMGTSQKSGDRRRNNDKIGTSF